VSTEVRPTATGSFRRFFSNWFALRFSDNDVSIIFGLEDQKGIGPVDGPVAEAQVIMTPRSAKVLMMALTHAIEQFEAQLGVISLPPGKAEELAAAIQVHKKSDAAP
jgi:hypothetical protein